MCANGFGGLSCQLQAVCHFWDQGNQSWSADGLQTMRGNPDATGVVGSSGYVTCLAKSMPAVAVEYAALWLPAPPPSAPPPPPNPNRRLSGTFTLAGAVNEFDQPKFDKALRQFAPSGSITEAEFTITAASINVLTTMTFGDAMDASAMKTKLEGSTLEELSTALNVTVEKISTFDLSAPPDGPVIKPIPLEQNPVFQTVMTILVLNLATLIWMRWQNYMYPQGLRGPKRKREKKDAKPTKPADAAKPAPQASQPLALMGPTEQMPALPQLYARFELEGEISTFAETQFIRRLATLIGVSDTQISATLSAGSSANVVVMDAEINCPDATTLVMAAKTLKKAPGPLGLALGVKLFESPNLTVPEEESVPRPAPAKGPPAATSMGPPTAAVADSVAPTIQERIPSINFRAGMPRRLVPGQMPTSLPKAPLPSAFMAPFAKAPVPSAAAPTAQPPAGAMDWQFQQGAGAIPGGMEEVAKQSNPPPPAPLEGGIQERISFAGMNKSSRRLSLSGTRSSAAPRLNASPDVPKETSLVSRAAAAAGGVLNSLNLTMELTEATPAGPPAVREGIQERLPAMPGMQRRRTNGEPRAKAAPVRTPPPASEAPSTSASAAAMPIQERLPRMTQPSAPTAEAPAGTTDVVSPPPSPPPVSPSKSTALVVKSEKLGAGSKFDTRLQTYPKVMPKEQPKDDLPETWDDRSVREIVWGTAREHTLVGFVAAFLYGEGSKLPTTFQAVQLFWLTLLALMFMACAQLRYNFLGPEWVLIADSSTVDTSARLPAVGIAASFITFPTVIVARWLFLLVNRTKAETTKTQRRIILVSAWAIVCLTYAALAIGACNMAINVDQEVAKHEIMGGWGLGVVMQWFIIEPLVLLLYVNINLLLKWCTSYEDLPENLQKAMEKQREMAKQEVIRKKEAMKKEAEAKAAAANKPVPKAKATTGTEAPLPELTNKLPSDIASPEKKDS